MESMDYPGNNQPSYEQQDIPTALEQRSSPHVRRPLQQRGGATWQEEGGEEREEGRSFDSLFAMAAAQRRLERERRGAVHIPEYRAWKEGAAMDAALKAAPPEVLLVKRKGNPLRSLWTNWSRYVRASKQSGSAGGRKKTKKGRTGSLSRRRSLSGGRRERGGGGEGEETETLVSGSVVRAMSTPDYEKVFEELRAKRRGGGSHSAAFPAYGHNVEFKDTPKSTATLYAPAKPKAEKRRARAKASWGTWLKRAKSRNRTASLATQPGT